MRCSHGGAPGMLYLLFRVCWQCVFSLSMQYCMQFFFGQSFICLSAVWCPVFVSVYFLFTFFSGLCSVRPAVSPLLRWFCKCDQCYQAFSTVMTMMMHKRKGHVFCVFSFFCVCPHCAICFGKSFNVTSVIKHFQQLWLWKSIRRWSMFFFFYSLYCWGNSSGVPTVLYASSVLGPNSRFGIRIRSIVFPCTFSIALTSVQSQLYPHVHRQSHWRVYTRTISILLVYPPRMKSA